MKEMRQLEKQKSQSGQATVEYILLLIVSVTLILGLANQIYRPFGNWVKEEMGAYTQCLLDLGELPALGGETTGECVNKFKGEMGKNSADSLAGKKGKNASSAMSGRNDDAAGGSGRGASSARGGGGAAGRNRGFPIGSGGAADATGAGTGSNELNEPLPESKFFKLRSNNAYSAGSAGAIKAKQLTGEVARGVQKRKTKEEAAFAVQGIETSEGTNKLKPMLVKPIERAKASTDEDTNWNFSEYLKYALILAIIVAIVLFVGGQISSITKSMEK